LSFRLGSLQSFCLTPTGVDYLLRVCRYSPFLWRLTKIGTLGVVPFLECAMPTRCPMTYASRPRLVLFFPSGQLASGGYWYSFFAANPLARQSTSGHSVAGTTSLKGRFSCALLLPPPGWVDGKSFFYCFTPTKAASTDRTPMYLPLAPPTAALSP